MATDKRTARVKIPKQLNLDFSLRNKILMMADAEDRSIGCEIMHLLREGVNAIERNNAQLRTTSHIPALDSNKRANRRRDRRTASQHKMSLNDCNSRAVSA